jgi:hypothetical protein
VISERSVAIWEANIEKQQYAIRVAPREFVSVLEDLQDIARHFDALVANLSGLMEFQTSNSEDIRRLEAARDLARHAAQLVRLQIELTQTSQ